MGWNSVGFRVVFPVESREFLQNFSDRALDGRNPNIPLAVTLSSHGKCVFHLRSHPHQVLAAIIKFPVWHHQRVNILHDAMDFMDRALIPSLAFFIV